MVIRRSAGSFTLLELLVAVGVVAILAAILIPATQRASILGQRTRCNSNMRQLTAAWLNYAVDNNGRLINADTSPTGWVLAGNSNSTITSGLLYPYTRTTAIYHCPSDTSNHVRSYSISEAVASGTGYGSVAYQLAQIRQSADTLVFVEENDTYQNNRTYNWGPWVQSKTGAYWSDVPAYWHDVGMNLSFADGHVEYWHWQDSRTTLPNINYAFQPNNPDLIRVQGVYNP